MFSSPHFSKSHLITNIPMRKQRGGAYYMSHWHVFSKLVVLEFLKKFIEKNLLWIHFRLRSAGCNFTEKDFTYFLKFVDQFSKRETVGFGPPTVHYPLNMKFFLWGSKFLPAPFQTCFMGLKTQLFIEFWNSIML